jgi:hypothetical protein
MPRLVFDNGLPLMQQKLGVIEEALCSLGPEHASFDEFGASQHQIILPMRDSRSDDVIRSNGAGRSCRQPALSGVALSGFRRGERAFPVRRGTVGYGGFVVLVAARGDGDVARTVIRHPLR